MTLSADQLSTIVSVATQNIKKDSPNLLAAANALFLGLKDRAVFQDGGRYIQQPLIYKKAPSKGWNNGINTVGNIDPSNNTTFAVFNWKYFAQALVITLQDLAQAQDTPDAAIAIVSQKIAELSAAVTSDFSQAMHQSGTTYPLQINGLPDVFATSGTAYGGLTDTDIAEWMPEINTTAQAPSYEVINNMMNKLNARVRFEGKVVTSSTTGGGSVPVYPKVNLMIANSAVVSAMINLNQQQQVFISGNPMKVGIDVNSLQSDTEKLKASADFMFNNCPVYIDEFTPGTATAGSTDNYLYLLNSASFDLFYRYGFDKTSPLDTNFIMPQQPVKLAVQYWVGNLMCKNRRLNGVFKNIAV